MPQKRKNLNLEINDRRIDDIGEKVGSIFGKKGQAIGKAIDDLTKDITIKIDTKDSKSQKRR